MHLHDGRLATDTRWLYCARWEGAQDATSWVGASPAYLGRQVESPGRKARPFHFDPFLDTMRRDLPASPERSVSEAASPERAGSPVERRRLGHAQLAQARLVRPLQLALQRRLALDAGIERRQAR